jgi:hypothetical protein
MINSEFLLQHERYGNRMNEIITNYRDLVLLIPPVLGLVLIIGLIVKR